jgi:integrase
MRPVAQKGRRGNDAYRVREHLTEAEMDKMLSALKGNRHGHRGWLIGLVIYRHGLRVSEACGLRWDDIDLRKRTIIVRRLKGSTDSVHYVERDGSSTRMRARASIAAGDRGYINTCAGILHDPGSAPPGIPIVGQGAGSWVPS